MKFLKFLLRKKSRTDAPHQNHHLDHWPPNLSNNYMIHIAQDREQDHASCNLSRSCTHPSLHLVAWNTKTKFRNTCCRYAPSTNHYSWEDEAILGPSKVVLNYSFQDQNL
ncbi:hypothetical protein LguiB_035879 [Lonicera macranthoides]